MRSESGGTPYLPEVARSLNTVNLNPVAECEYRQSKRLDIGRNIDTRSQRIPFGSTEQAGSAPSLDVSRVDLVRFFAVVVEWSTSVPFLLLGALGGIPLEFHSGWTALENFVEWL